MKVQGFTLVELLAVIVILAVLALIATPVVLSIIDDAKESAMLRSAEMYISGVENAVMRENMNTGGNFRPTECTISSEGNLDCEGKEGIIEVEVNGEKPKNGNIVFENGKIIEVELVYETGIIIKDENGNLVYSGDETDTNEDKTILEPGLYDENDNLLISWNDLISLDYASFTFGEDIYNEEGFWNGTEERTRSILTVEDGVLKSSYGMDLEELDYKNFSADYLNGKLVLDNNIVEIGEDCFNSCIGLTEIEIKNSVTKIGPSAFSNCTFERIKLPNSITEIGESAFGYCSNISEIIIPDSVISIGSYAFNNCTKLETVKLPDTLTNIDRNMFYNCTSLKAIEIPDSVTSIGENAFQYCKSLPSVIIPDNVTDIGTGAFNNCTSLKTIEIPKSVNNIGGSVFYNTPWLNSKQSENPLVVINGILIDGKVCNGAVTLPNSITKIADYAFYRCTSITSITIPSSVKNIGSYAFSECTNLTSVTIQSGVESIGSYAFEECPNLTSITIPEGVKSIGLFAFYKCTKLKTISIPKSVERIDERAVYNCDSITTINYAGTKAEWNGISKSNIWHYYNPTFTIYCTDGSITIQSTK